MLKGEFVKFLLAGGVNTAVYYLLYATFVYLGLNYAISAFIATSIGVFFSYFTIGRFVFAKEAKFSFLWRFLLNYAVLYFVNIFVIFMVHTSLHVDVYISGLVATFTTALLAFFSNKYFVFVQR